MAIGAITAGPPTVGCSTLGVVVVGMSGFNTFVLRVSCTLPVTAMISRVGNQKLANHMISGGYAYLVPVSGLVA